MMLGSDSNGSGGGVSVTRIGSGGGGSTDGVSVTSTGSDGGGSTDTNLKLAAIWALALAALTLLGGEDE